MFAWGIKTINFSGGETIPVDEASTLVIIGPNNCGKSTALKGIENHLTSNYPNSRVIVSVERFLRGSAADFEKWLEDHFPKLVDSSGNVSYATRRQVIDQKRIPAVFDKWEKREYLSNEDPSRFLCHALDTGSRIGLAGAVSSKRSEGEPENYIHVLQMNETLMDGVSREVRKAFGKSLIINWAGGPTVWFHVGDEPTRTIEKDRVSRDYAQELLKVPKLDEEGDGIRSFIGIVLACYCDAHAVLLIDEPEAFLHPPQIRRLAGMLAKNAEGANRQIVLATHSSEAVQGALAASTRVSICRITRDGDVNHAKLLSRSDIEELWSKPLLRSAAAIDGVFHDGVVVSEADSDSRIYEALLERLDKKGQLKHPIDVYFIQGGGKGELATIARAYVALGVRTAVIADFDVLQNRAEFEKLFTSLGGRFEIVEANYRATISALRNLGPIVKRGDLIGALENKIQNLKATAGETVPPELRKDITTLIEEAADWSEAKKYGILKLKGTTHTACRDLLESCKTIGLFVVPEGALESWWREGPAEKNQWFTNAIVEIAAQPESFASAQGFISEVCSYLSQKADLVGAMDSSRVTSEHKDEVVIANEATDPCPPPKLGLWARFKIKIQQL